MSAVLTGKEPHPVIPLLEPELEEQWRKIDAKKIEEYYAIRREAMMLESLDPYRNGYEPEIWRKADAAMAKKREEFPVGVIEELDLGGNRACLIAGEQTYDPIFDRYHPVEAPYHRHVWAWNGTKWVIAKAEPAFSRGVLPCVRVELSDGLSFACSRTHRVLTDQGWMQCGDLRSGQRLVGFSPDLVASSSGTYPPESFSDVLRLNQTPQDSHSHYFDDSRLGDEQPLTEAGNAPDAFPLQADAAKRESFSGNIRHWLFSLASRLLPNTRDGLDNTPERSHADLIASHPSTQGAPVQSAVQSADTQFLHAYKLYRSASGLSGYRVTPSACRQSNSGFFLPESSYEYLAPDKRYDCERPCNTITTHVTLVQDIGEYECWDFHVPVYENYMHAGVCHHNSKTERIAKRLVKLLVEKPGSKVWFLQSTQSISRQSQQPIVWKYIPREWKPVSGRSKRDLTTKINYTQAGGFTEDTFVLPNGSQGWFRFYSVPVTDMEGPELDAAWSDELVTPEWLEFLRYRLVTRNGILTTTFTPVEGYSATVKTYLDNAKTVEEVDAEMLPIRDEKGEVTAFEKVPRIQQPQNDRAVVVYFHTADNPYGNYPSMKETLRGKPRETILMRAYGVPSKTFGAALPMFRRNVHVITTEQWMRWVKKFPNMSRYHLVDPCSGRNWFMGWVACPMPNKMIFYREWPSHGHLGAYIPGIGDPGPWAIAGKAHDGEKGPAQTAFGFGLDRYKHEIERVESGEDVSERWMDARYGNSPTMEREGTVTLIEKMDELDMSFRAMTSEKSILGNNDGSLDMINSALYYDLGTPLGEFSKELSKINEPELLVVETCPNTIYALENWTGKDGQQGACKDPIDVIRGAFLSELEFISDAMLQPHQPWLKQFAA